MNYELHRLGTASKRFGNRATNYEGARRLAIFATIALSECNIISPNKVNRIMTAEHEVQEYLFNVLIEPRFKGTNTSTRPTADVLLQ